MKFFNTNNQAAPALKLIPLGGTTDVTKNMYVYEYGNDIVVVDCGIGFPDSEMLGVDVVIPDFSYLIQNRAKIRGIVISHGHEDHFGALPFVLKELPEVPVYATKLVQGFISNKLKDQNLTKISQRLVDTETTILHLGAFEISFFHTNHSVPESQGIVIKTPVGVIMHVPDYKFDWTPVMGKPFDVQRALQLGGNNVLALLSDCLGATNEGYTASERSIEDTFDHILDKSEGHQVFITTVSSNISRISQAIRSAIKHNRRVVVAGRSLNQNILVAQNMGLLSFPPDTFVPDDQSRKVEQASLLYLVAGAYGQSGSALWRIANDEHKTIKIEDEAAVIFSADPIPGVHDQVNAIIDHLTYRGAEVYYSQIQENLHVSGHGSQGDLLMLAGIIRPKYFIPIGGTIHHMRAYRNMIEKMGVTKDRIFEWVEGQTLEFTPGLAKFGTPIETRNVFVDGGQVGEVGSVVIKDRQALSQDGVLVISLPYDRKERRFIDRVQIVSRGFVYVKESQGLMNKVSGLASNVVRRQAPGSDVMAVKNDIEREVGHFLFKETGRNPVVLASIVEI